MSKEKRKPFMPDQGEGVALDVLKEHKIKHIRGMIQLPRGTKDPELLDAVDYLCGEWDYGLEWIEPA